MATHSSILAWRIPWTEEPGGLQSIGSQRVRHDWSDLAFTRTYPTQSLRIDAIKLRERRMWVKKPRCKGDMKTMFRKQFWAYLRVHSMKWETRDHFWIQTYSKHKFQLKILLTLTHLLQPSDSSPRTETDRKSFTDLIVLNTDFSRSQEG